MRFTSISQVCDDGFALHSRYAPRAYTSHDSNLQEPLDLIPSEGNRVECALAHAIFQWMSSIDMRTFPELLLPLYTRKVHTKNTQVTIPVLHYGIACNGNPTRFVLRGAFDAEWIPEVHGGARRLRASNCERHSS